MQKNFRFLQILYKFLHILSQFRVCAFLRIIESPRTPQGFFVACSAESLQGARQNVTAAPNRGAGFSAVVMCSALGLGSAALGEL
jgi:hypothetical protein